MYFLVYLPLAFAVASGNKAGAVIVRSFAFGEHEGYFGT